MGTQLAAPRGAPVESPGSEPAGTESPEQCRGWDGVNGMQVPWVGRARLPGQGLRQLLKREERGGKLAGPRERVRHCSS